MTAARRVEYWIGKRMGATWDPYWSGPYAYRGIRRALRQFGSGFAIFRHTTERLALPSSSDTTEQQEK